MKSFYSFVILVILPLLSFGQFNEEIGTIGNVNINISPGDTINLMEIDSILESWNKRLNIKEPPSKNFGHAALKTDSIEAFSPANVVRVPDSYVLGVNDEIAISIFGRSQFEGKYKVDKAGFISPKQMPKIYLKGLTLAKARTLATKRFSSYYRFDNEQFAFIISQPRLITVNIFGEVERPGSYSLSALNTAYNALIIAGGPTTNGNIRNIGLYSDRNSKTLDVYNLIHDPTKRFDFYLDDNMIITVPSSDKRVSVKGAVKKSLVYDLKEEEGLFELIKFAGGLRPQTVREVVNISRYENDKKILLDINLNELEDKNQNFSLKDGDEITFRRISANTTNGVFVEGAVLYPGSYSFYEGVRISDILHKAKIKTNARSDVAFIMRKNTDATVNLIEFNLDESLENENSDKNFVLQNYDRIIINDKSEFVDLSTISVSGAVRKDIEHPFHKSAKIKLNQAILLAGGLRPEAKDEGYIIRSNPSNQKEKSYVKINVRDALTNEQGDSNINLLPWDRVVILSNSQSSEVLSVSISGAVRDPRTIDYNEYLNLKDLIILSSGLKDLASKTIYVYRTNKDSNQQGTAKQIKIEIDEDYNIISAPKNFKLEPFDEVVVYNLPYYQNLQYVQIKGQVMSPGKYALTSTSEKLTSILQKAGGLTNAGFPEGAVIYRELGRIDSITNEISYYKVITDLDKALKDPSSKFNSILRNGDVIQIPKKTEEVYINLTNTQASNINQSIDNVEKVISVPYEIGKNSKWYIEEYAGGFVGNIKPEMVKIKYANGSIKRGKSGLFKRYPEPKRGSTIYIDKSDINSERKKQGNQQRYPNLKKGVILNITPNGKITETPINNG